MRRFILILVIICNINAQNNKSLNSIFKNALISDVSNNIKREQPIKIIAINKESNSIKTNYNNLGNLLLKSSNNEPWFITQSEEATTLVEIIDVDVNTGWITLGETFSGVFNMDEGETLEFFNPFLNYNIINNKPLFEPYPTHINDNRINYIQSGGIIERSKNDYVLLTPVVFGAHKTRAIYYATSNDLENWNFKPQKILGTEDIPFAKKYGNVFSTGNPLLLDNNTYLILLGVEKPDNTYTSAYMIVDNNLQIIQKPKEITLSNWQDTNHFPLSIVKHNNLYRILFHKRHRDRLQTEVLEITTKDIFKTLDENYGIITSIILQKADETSGYLRGKADDASYFIFNSELYIILGCEEAPSEYLTSINREYGLLKLKNKNWEHDKRSPLIINPMTIHNKYPKYEWTADHLGGFISPILKENNLYIFLTFGTDNPDYLLSGIKIKLD